jgi:hypothetical protein
MERTNRRQHHIFIMNSNLESQQLHAHEATDVFGLENVWDKVLS